MNNAAAPAPRPSYRLSTRKFCPTCGGKAQDAQVIGQLLGDDDEVLAAGEPCDEPYHDADDEDYCED